ncbi:hypothetical protein CLV47_12333 [Antricoccus suffuscus]|uniref:Uncharacterized protein n=1 Tax=Antricoccus suffuscus TaxID=1629062 RepID=A0A2T0ZER2_9ACTN|nr:ribbon-helix-helix domain-containing protein [Antricoccus suffuscus]PRZ34801.1 hypothetical protein CLV47_12333 [Antricoccus suffuscus]
MNAERPPLAAAPGLAKGVVLPPPPARPAAQRPQPPTEPAEPVPNETPTREPTVTEDPAPSNSASRQRPGRPRPVGSATTKAEGAMQAITLSLPADLVVVLKARAREDRATQPETLMDALSATRERLADLVAEAHAPTVSDGLFLRRQPRTSSEPMATLSMRLLSGNVEAIDRLVASSGAPSRSALCAAALRAYLAVS